MSICSGFCFATLTTLAEGKVAQCFKDLHLSEGVSLDRERLEIPMTSAFPVNNFH